LGHDTLVTGLTMLPGGLVMGLLAPVVGRLYDRIGPRPLLIPGAALVSVVLWSMTLFGPGTPVGGVVAAHVLMSLGLGLMLTPLLTGALGSLEPSLYSHGSAVVGTIQQVAGAAGTASFVAVMSAVSVNRIAGGMDEITAQADGITTAFTMGAMIFLPALAAYFLVRDTATTDKNFTTTCVRLLPAGPGVECSDDKEQSSPGGPYDRTDRPARHGNERIRPSGA